MCVCVCVFLHVCILSCVVITVEELKTRNVIWVKTGKWPFWPALVRIFTSFKMERVHI